MNLTALKTVFAWIARQLLEIFGNSVVQQVILDELEKFAKRTDTKVDDKLVRMARLALANEDYLKVEADLPAKPESDPEQKW